MKEIMNTQIREHEEAIRKLVSRIELQKPTEGFSARIMERLIMQPEPVNKWMIYYQYGVLAVAASVAILFLIFPAWTVFDFDMKMAGASAANMAGNLFSSLLVKVGQSLSQLGPIGKYAYFIPASFALLVLAIFDQIVSRKAETNTNR